MLGRGFTICGESSVRVYAVSADDPAATVQPPILSCGFLGLLVVDGSHMRQELGAGAAC